jgi:hypothetical protein
LGEHGGEGRAAFGSAKQPYLRFAHAEETIRANPSFSYWEAQPTDIIVATLRPGTRSPLTVKPDGTVLDGNTRVWILQE